MAAAVLAVLAGFAWRAQPAAPPPAPAPRPAAPEVILGDRLFFEPRFARHFHAHAAGDVNVSLAQGEALVDQVRGPGRRLLPGPFAGAAVSCRHCHLGDDLLALDPWLGRTYCDFSPRSAVPERDDGRRVTARNAPMMVGLTSRGAPATLHFDGEFTSLEELTVETWTGREFGWLPDERAAARAHVARVLRRDEGRFSRGVTRAGRGLPYRVALRGTAPDLPPHLRLPAGLRLDVERAGDDEVLHAAARLVAAYVDSLRFAYQSRGARAVSPYDAFLAKNGLPAAPRPGESDAAYSRRLGAALARLRAPRWVDGRDGRFELHGHEFRFGPLEHEGARLFFDAPRGGHERGAGCVRCHPAPDFTDRRFHNTGAAQAEYDGLFGAGAFMVLGVPGLAERNAAPEEYLPATPGLPGGSGRFRSPASPGNPGRTDLGVWNILAHPDRPRPQPVLLATLCAQVGLRGDACRVERALPRSLARFKTPGLRDLGHSAPYLHTGALETLPQVLDFYATSARLARDGALRNAAPELLSVHVSARGRTALTAFLQALDEDYR